MALSSSFSDNSEQAPLLSRSSSATIVGPPHSDAHPSYQSITTSDGTVTHDARSENGHDVNASINADNATKPKEMKVKESPPWSKLVPILASLWMAVFMGALDGTIVATLLSSISSSFDASNQSSWLGSSYLLSVCCFTPIYGRLSDIIGRRSAMLIALGFFILGTIACGLAPSMQALIAARALAGVGGGGMMTCSSIIVTDLIPIRKRGLYQGMANILFGAGAGLGGPLGGFLNDTKGWRFAFLAQVPFLILAFVCVSIFVNVPLPESGQTLREKLARIDYLGSLTLVITIASLLLSLSFLSSEDMPFTHPLVWGLFVNFIVFAIVFVAVEIWVAKAPVMPMRLLRQRTPLFVSLSNLTCSGGAFAVLYMYPMYFQAVQLQSAKVAGYHLIPNSVALSLGSVGAGLWMRATGKYWNFNVFCAILPVISFSYICTWGENVPKMLEYIAIVPGGFGVSSIITTTLIALISGVSRSDLAVATGVSYLFRSTGQVLGVAVSGTLLQSLLTSQLKERITGEGSNEIISAIRHNASIVPTLPLELRNAAVESYRHALRAVFIFITAVYIVTFLLCLPIGEHDLGGLGDEKKGCGTTREEGERPAEEGGGEREA